jgi:hypothetical protein
MTKEQMFLTKKKDKPINFDSMKNSSRNKTAKQDDLSVNEKDNKTLADHSPAVANNVTDAVKNTASVTEGRNQAKTKKNDLEPGTH